MSKSAGEKHFINVFGEEARIRKQIKSAVTDTGEAKEGEMSAGVQNLFSLLKASGRIDAHTSLMDDYNSGALKYSDLKESVAEGLVAISKEFKARKAEIVSDRKQMKNKIKQSSFEIRKTAQQTVKDVKELAGLSNVRF
jgi:tryptophanyl-tRNA synthetase